MYSMATTDRWTRPHSSASRRYFGHKVAYFGGMGEHAPAANSADVSIAVAESLEKELPDSHVVLRQPDLENLVLLRLNGHRQHGEPQRSACKSPFHSTSTCAAAALFLNFPILAVVVLTTSALPQLPPLLSALKSAVESADEELNAQVTIFATIRRKENSDNESLLAIVAISSQFCYRCLVIHHGAYLLFRSLICAGEKMVGKLGAPIP